MLYISAMFLTYYARRCGDEGALQVVRGYALAWSGPTILASVFAFFMINKQNPVHFQSMLELARMFIASFVCFLMAVYLVWKKRYLGFAFVLVILQFGFAWFGYGASHLPYILYDYIHLYEHFTNDSMAIALIAVFVLGLIVLLPSLALIMRLFLFDAKYMLRSTRKGES